MGPAKIKIVQYNRDKTWVKLATNPDQWYAVLEGDTVIALGTKYRLVKDFAFRIKEAQ